MKYVKNFQIHLLKINIKVQKSETLKHYTSLSSLESLKITLVSNKSKLRLFTCFSFSKNFLCLQTILTTLSTELQFTGILQILVNIKLYFFSILQKITFIKEYILSMNGNDECHISINPTKLTTHLTEVSFYHKILHNYWPFNISTADVRRMMFIEKYSSVKLVYMFQNFICAVRDQQAYRKYFKEVNRILLIGLKAQIYVIDIPSHRTINK